MSVCLCVSTCTCTCVSEFMYVCASEYMHVWCVCECVYGYASNS